MTRISVSLMLLITFSAIPLSPIFSHTSSGSDCGSLLGEIGSAAANLAAKGWALTQAYLRKRNAEGLIETAAANLAYLRAGLAARSARNRLSNAWSHWTEHCVVRNGFMGT